MIQQNHPDLWKDRLPAFGGNAHKYDRGVAVIYGAPSMTGATRLAAMGCARVGAGLVKVVAPQGVGQIYRETLPAHIIVEDEEFSQPSPGHFADLRCRALLMGPGCLADWHFFTLFEQALRLDHLTGIVLDAGAFQACATSMPEMKSCSSPDRVIVTPHEGEFKKFFESHVDGVHVLAQSGKIEQAEVASKAINNLIVLKGAQTVIADGIHETIVQDRPLPQMATGGTGDVLAGMITGLMAQGMEARWAAAAAVWIHAEAGARFGAGLVASDLPDLIPAVLQDIIKV